MDEPSREVTDERGKIIDTGQRLPQGEPQQPPEPTESEPEGVKETSEDGHQKPTVTEDAMYNLFTTEVVEENDLSKLAESLNDVNARDLLGEARDLINQLNRNRKR